MGRTKSRPILAEGAELPNARNSVELRHDASTRTAIVRLKIPRGSEKLLAGMERKRSAEPARHGGGVSRKRRLSDSGLNTRSFKSPKRRTLAGRRAELQICPACLPPNSFPRNSLVTCGKCSQAWHRQCHDPPIPQDPCAILGMFLCHKCLNSSGTAAPPSDESLPVPVQENDGGIAPHGAVFRPSGPNGPSRKDFCDSDRLRYFSALSTAELLELLAFCHKHHHDILVDLLVELTKKNPELPIFEYLDWAVRSRGLLDSLVPRAEAGGLSNCEAEQGVSGEDSVPIPQKPPLKIARQKIQIGEAEIRDLTYGHVSPVAAGGKRISKPELRGSVCGLVSRPPPLSQLPPSSRRPPPPPKLSEGTENRDAEHGIKNDGAVATKPVALRRRRFNPKKNLRALQQPFVVTPLEDEAMLPESWPKVGQGMYASLKPEKTDFAYLVENDTAPSFIHCVQTLQTPEISKRVGYGILR